MVQNNEAMEEKLKKQKLPTIPAKHILSSWQKDGWFGTGYTMNLYKGCCHGCIYCDSRSDCYQIERFDQVRAKENALAVLEQDLHRTRRKGLILTGSMSDPYNPFEQTEQLTRGAIRLCWQYGFEICILTKSDLVLRDLGWLMRLSERSPVAVVFTITAAEDDLCKKIEPNVCPTSARLAAMRQLTAAGILCGAVLTPILPFLEDTPQNVSRIIKEVAEAGGAFCYAGPQMSFGVTQRAGQREYFHQQLAKTFPGMEQKYRAAFGGRYFCASPRIQELQQVFVNACKDRGLLYRMPQIEAKIKGFDPTQLSFL